MIFLQFWPFHDIFFYKMTPVLLQGAMRHFVTVLVLFSSEPNKSIILTLVGQS